MTESHKLLAQKAFNRKSSQPMGALRKFAGQFVEELLSVLFPLYGYDGNRDEASLQLEIRNLQTKLERALELLKTEGVSDPSNVASNFFEELPKIYDLLLLDAEATHKGDPAAKSVEEVILCYPGFFAISTHRFAHTLFGLNVPLLPRVLSEFAHTKTGIDIHPGARIGRSFYIDHGTGVVVGETSIIKDNVTLYQGVTLGGLVVKKELQNMKRHPTLENSVIVYANATILGGETIIGAGSIIGGSVWLTSSVAPNSVVYHKGDLTIRKTDTVNL